MRVCAKKIIVLMIVLVFVPGQAFAQALSVSLSPSSPKPGETVVVSVDSFLIDVENTLVRWLSDGEILNEGFGRNRITISDVQNQIIVVEVQDPNSGEMLRQQIRITPSNVDLLWETIGSYTPPFYKGKTLPTLESSINVVAIPDRQNRDSLSYTWAKEFVDQPSQSGFGKNSFGFIGNPLELANTISVEVSASQGSYAGANETTITYQPAEIIFYEEDVDLGTMFNRALTSGHNLNGEDITITAIPYFTGVENINDESLVMEWETNGTRLTNQPTRKNMIRFTSPGSGEAFISVAVRHLTRLFERGEVGIRLDL